MTLFLPTLNYVSSFREVDIINHRSYRVYFYPLSMTTGPDSLVAIAALSLRQCEMAGSSFATSYRASDG